MGRNERNGSELIIPFAAEMSSDTLSPHPPAMSVLQRSQCALHNKDDSATLKPFDQGSSSLEFVQISGQMVCYVFLCAFILGVLFVTLYS